MSKEEKRTREFYVYRVTRSNEDVTTDKENENKPDEKYIISPHYGRQPAKTVIEDMGYRRDPSTYDFIRPNHGVKKENYDVNRYKKTEEPTPSESESYVIPPEEINIGVEEPTPVVEQIKEPVTRANYVPVNRAATAVSDEELSIEALPTDIFDREYDETISVKPSRPAFVTKAPTSEMPRPKIQTREQLEEQRRPMVNISAPKVSKYVPPKLEMLEKTTSADSDDQRYAEKQKEIINRTFREAGVKAEVAEYIFGPTVTQFLIKVAPGVNVNTINPCAQNLAMYLEAEQIRIQTPIPGKPYAGIEVPKREEDRRIVYLGDIIGLKQYREAKMALPVAVGKDNAGSPMIIDLAEMPHCLVAGTTKSGKSVCLNAFILSLIYRFSPKDVRLVLIDPKRVEFSPYEETPHLAMPVITNKEDFPAALGWVYEEMERRYEIFEYYHDRDLKELNAHLVEEKKAKLPYIVMIMDEFGDWIANAAPEVEDMIQKIAAKARAAGIHVILAAQRPSKDIIKGSIKANFDTRIAFKVSAFEDSKVILGYSGAEKLEGHGDMLIRYAGKTDRRLQGAFVSNANIKTIINYLRANNKCDYIVTKEEIRQSTLSRQAASSGPQDRNLGLEDEHFEEIAYYVVRNHNASSNNLTQEFNMGFNRVNSILSALEKLGVLSQAIKGKQRDVLVDEYELEEILKNL